MRNRDVNWKELPFSQGELEQAARAAGQAITDSLPEPEDCTYTFSDDFRWKMDSLTQKTDRSGWTTGLRRVACFCLVFLVGGVTWVTVEAQMSEQVFGWDRETAPEVLYQEYEAIVEEANETHDVDLTLAPLEEMDPDRMPSVNKFQHDVDEMVEAVQYIAQYQGGQVPERTFAQEFFRELFNLDRRYLGLGDRIISEITDSYAAELGMTWNVDVNVVISTPTGPVDFYVQKILGEEMTAGEMPDGYTVKAVGATWSQVSSDLKACAVYRQFVLTQNGVSTTVIPWIVLEVNRDTGAVVVSEDVDGRFSRECDLETLSQGAPELLIGYGRGEELIEDIRIEYHLDLAHCTYVSCGELFGMAQEDMPWEWESLLDLTMDLYTSGEEGQYLPYGYLYLEDRAFTMVERPDDMIALEEYKLLPSEEVERWEALYQLVEVLVSSPHPSEIRSMLEQ